MRTDSVAVTNADSASSVFAADVDSDGDLDILFASAYDDKIAWYENDGSQSFTTHAIVTNASGASSVFAADVDSDGDLDILSASGKQVRACGGLLSAAFCDKLRKTHLRPPWSYIL